MSEVDSRTQGSWPRPTPRTQKIRGKAKDQLLEDRPSRGQGQEYSRPRTKDKSFKKFFFNSKKKVFKNFFQAISEKKKGFCKFSARFLSFSNKILAIQKIVLSSAKDRAIFEDLRIRGQGLPYVSSRAFSRTSTSTRTPPRVYAIETEDLGSIPGRVKPKII